MNVCKAETAVLWPPHAKSWLIGKDSDAARDWGREEKETTEDEMAGWHHWPNGRESEWTPGVGDGQGGLACCDSWGSKESDTTERLNWTESLHHTQYLKPCKMSFVYPQSSTNPIIQMKTFVAIWGNMDRPRDYHITYMWNPKYDTNILIYKTKTDSQT